MFFKSVKFRALIKCLSHLQVSEVILGSDRRGNMRIKLVNEMTSPPYAFSLMDYLNAFSGFPGKSRITKVQNFKSLRNIAPPE